MEKIALIVEDSPVMRHQVKMLLEKQGMIVREAGNKIGMMNRLDEYGKRVDIVIMDLNLKEEYGFDLIEALKSSKEYNDIPVLILTQYADKEKVLKAKELGITAYAKKPIDSEDLIRKVNMLLEENKDNT